jgi:hypothetical protein
MDNTPFFYSDVDSSFTTQSFMDVHTNIKNKVFFKSLINNVNKDFYTTWNNNFLLGGNNIVHTEIYPVDIYL